MKTTICLLLFLLIFFKSEFFYGQRIFDTHLHGDPNITEQLNRLESVGVYKAAVSTSWQLQATYESNDNLEILQGLMLACPYGKVPYSGQYCFQDRSEFPNIAWVESLIKENKIDFMGEVLSQYYGISASDELLFPY